MFPITQHHDYSFQYPNVPRTDECAQKAAADRAGPDVIFVEYDSYVGQFHGRYCEAGVDESSSESNTRSARYIIHRIRLKLTFDRVGLMFYELNTWDPAGTTPWKRSNDDPLNGTFEADLDIFAQITQVLDPNATFSNPEANSASSDSSFREDAIQLPNLLPDG